MKLNDLMNPYQKSSFVAALRRFEEDLRQTDAWIQGKEEQGILYQRKLTLSPEKKKAASEGIAVALEQIAFLARSLDLQLEEEDPAGLIRGLMSDSWSNLLESNSGKLKRYGKVDPRAGALLDPLIDRLAQTALYLAQLFDNHDGGPDK